MTVIIREKDLFSSEEQEDIQKLNEYTLERAQEIIFIWKNNQYWLVSRDEKEKPIGVMVDQEIEYHLQFFKKSSLYQELVAKAVGVKPQVRPQIFDMSAGLLGDSLMLLAMGCQVHAFERNPVVAFLLKYALKNSHHDLKHHLKFSFLDASKAIELVTQNDVIFFDPMFEDFNEKSAPKKEMRIFRELLGVDLDSKKIAEELLAKKAKRLVIKRPRHSAELLEVEAVKYLGKSVRYDVYFSAHLA